MYELAEFTGISLLKPVRQQSSLGEDEHARKQRLTKHDLTLRVMKNTSWNLQEARHTNTRNGSLTNQTRSHRIFVVAFDQ